MEHRIPCSGGGQLTRRPHALSYDGDAIIVCNADRLCVYSTLSGERLYDLRGHVDEVTGICLHPRSKNQIYSCSKDGTMKLWNLDDGTCISTWAIPGNLPIEDIVVVDDVAFVSYFWRGSDAGRALAFDLVKGEAKEMRVKLSTPRTVVSSMHANGEEAVVATYDRHTILVWEAGSFGRRTPLALHHTKAFTCVAVSRDGTKLAAGDVSGRILIWHTIRDGLSARVAHAERVRQKGWNDDDGDYQEPWTYTEPPAATVHWHAHAVGCIEFSEDGRYLLSGGHEAVLVMWDILSGSRGYLPRLGGAIVGISSCRMEPSIYCLRQADNTIRVVNTASMLIECSIHGVRPLPEKSQSVPLVVEPHRGLAVIPGPDAILQFYDIVHDVHVDRLQLSRRNIVSITQDNQKQGNIAPTVQSVAFSRDASFLVSVESQLDVSRKYSRQTLKFWDRSTEESRQYGRPYVLNTVSENPHRNSDGDYRITDIAISEVNNMVASASDSGDFALWTCDCSEPLGQMGRKAWKKLGQMPGHRGDPLNAIAFSREGALIAVSGDQQVSGGVSIWDALTCSLLGECPGAFIKGGGRDSACKSDYLFFIPRSPLLVLVHSFGIVVYNILSLDIVWCSDIVGISSVASDPHSSHWAVILEQERSLTQGDFSRILILFEGGDKKPKAGWTIQEHRSSTMKPHVLNPVCHTSTMGLDPKSHNTQCSPRIAFIPSRTGAFESSHAISVPGCSPILVFSQDGEFSIATRPDIARVEDIMDVSSVSKAADGKENLKGDNRRTYRDLFGSSAKADMHAQVGLPLYDMPERNASVFSDLPSHALPPIADLCSTFLEALLEP